MQKKILEVLINKKSFDQPPIWLMRQAGRYLPEYKEIRSKAVNFLDLCYNPKLAAQVTLQPITRFGFDAAIIFSDILVIADSIGGGVEFIEGKGPKLKVINDEHDLSCLKIDYNCRKLDCTAQTIELVKSKLSTNTALIGFAGSPWTVAAYMLEGTSKDNFSQAKLKCINHRELVNNLITMITEVTIIYLKNQIKAGADVIQLFDSWAGILQGEEYDDFVIKPTKAIVDELKKEFPKLPIIGFPRNSYFLYEKYCKMTKVDGLSLDYNLPLDAAASLQERIPIQGNLDPIILLSNDKNIIKNRVESILDKVGHKPFIFNLGHGILPETPIENVEFLIDIIRGYKK